MKTSQLQYWLFMEGEAKVYAVAQSSTPVGSFLGSDDGLSRRDVFGCACECRAN